MERTNFYRYQMFKLYIVFFLVIYFYTNEAKSQISIEDLSSVINVSKLEHPYLFFTNEEKIIIKERINSERKYKNIWEALLVKGNRYVRMPFEKKILFEKEHPRYERDNEATSYISEISDGAITLAFLYQMTSDEKYAKRAIEFALALCDVPEWVNGAHKFDVIYSRVWPWNVPDDQVVFSFDITAAGRARLLAIVYDWIYPALSLYERDKIRNALLEKAITRVRGNYEFFWWSSAYRCNWSAVCYAGLGVTALSLLKENPQLLDVVAEAYNRFNLIFDQIGDNGEWQEGRGYYVFMLEHSVYFMEALKRVSNGKYNLFMHKKIHDHPFDFPLFTLTAAFEDSEGLPVGSSYLVNKFVEETNNNIAAWYSEKFIREGDNIFDIIWPKSKVKPVEPKEKSKLFKHINWAIMRSDFFDPSAVTIACKAGYNDDPHHGHLDCGQFILTWHDIPFIKDLGRMIYDEHYFSEERYDYPYASSAGHNVIFVNGEQQIIAKKKNQPWKKGIGGEILKFQTSEKRDYVLMDPTHAYPNKQLKKWRRNIILEKPNITVLLDEVGSEIGAKIEARFFPGVASGSNLNSRILNRLISNPNLSIDRILPRGINYEVMENYVFLTDGKNNMALIPLVLDNNFKIVEDYLFTMPVTVEAELLRFPYVQTVVNANSNTSIIITIFLPVNDKKEADLVSSNAKINKYSNNQLEIVINAKEKTFKWLFEKNEDGYILKE